jgi:general secretion pathway protein G
MEWLTVSGDDLRNGMSNNSKAKRPRGFTLIELLVVLAILATLVAIAVPRYHQAVDRAREVTLRSNLRQVREAIDKYHTDTGRLPDTLQRLADARYLRGVPLDPITERVDSWLLTPHPDGVTPGVYDLRSGAEGTARDGSAYSSW